MNISFLDNWRKGNKISSFSTEGCYAKFRYGDNFLETFIVISHDSIAVAISNDNCTFSKIWKEDKNITQDLIKKEINEFLEESERKLV